MKHKLWRCFVFLCSIPCICLASKGTLRYCVPGNMVYGEAAQHVACEKFNREQNDIKCEVAEDRLECFKMLADGKADFMVAEPEDLLLMKAHNEANVVVTHQLKNYAKAPEQDVEMIVLVRKISNDSYTTKGKKLCYLGLENSGSMKFNSYYTSYFESWLFQQECDSEKHMLENRLAGLSQHFQSACIAGPWSLDRKLDIELKSKYGNLCKLCRNPKTCDDKDIFYGMNGALMCLMQEAGDITWINRVYANKYLPRLVSYGYHFLCPDGNLVKMTFDNMDTSCSWIVDPRPVILANKGVASSVLERVTDLGKEGDQFYYVIHTSYRFSHLSKLDKAQTVPKYLERFPGYTTASKKSHSQACRPVRSFRWCVSSSLEYRKCQALQEVADSHEIKPVFTCVKLNSREDCVKAVASNRCDVFVAYPSEIVKARKLGAKAIIDLMANKDDDSNSVAAIVKRKSKYNSLVDLKGAKACFTGYKSVGWNSFLSTLKNQSYQLDCSDSKTVSNFFHESCVLNIGVGSPQNLRSLCNKTDTQLGVEEKTFQCLMNGADVAFVNVSAARTYASHRVFFNLEYRLLCPTANNEEHCCLGKMTVGSIIAHGKITKVMENDILLAFLKFDSYFGKTYDRETPMFEMYETFEDHDNVIFPNATVKLERAMPGSYGEDLEFPDTCLSQSDADRTRFETSVVIVSVIFNIALTYFMRN